MIDQALAAYARAQELDPHLKVSAESWNMLCWFGSLSGKPREVMFACDKAVAMSGNSGNIRDTRGVARALNGDIQGAMEDFEAYLGQTYPEQRLEQLKAKRRQWVAELRKGKNPFTPEEVEALKNE